MPNGHRVGTLGRSAGARSHFEFAADKAPAHEIGYAAEAHEWRYQEEG